MTIERINHLENKTIISVLEPTHFGTPDRQREVAILYESPELLTITQEELTRKLSEAPFGLPNTMDKIDIPRFGTIVFLNTYDNDYSSSTWRWGVHSVSGPYLLVEGGFKQAAFDKTCNLIIPDFERINDELIAYFCKHPNDLNHLAPRKFEEVLAAIFRNLGYITELGPGHGDKGIDLRLIYKDSIGEVVTLVQAKRYASHNPIRLEAVQALYGIVEAHKANRGLFVTTSRYLPGVMEFAEQTSSRLVLATAKEVAIWCQQATGSRTKTTQAREKNDMLL
jgi:hypothetical protein